MNRNEIYNRITEKLIIKIESGVIPWRRNWSIGSPTNMISKRPYNGINFLSLIAEDHPSPYYLSFLQCKEKGATINKGATGSLIVFWKVCERNIEEGNKGSARIPFLRYSYTFNLSDTSLCNTEAQRTSITSAEELISKLQNLPPIKNNYRRCAYSLIDDFITLPVISDFDNQAEYYSALFHEAIHSTGHPSRLNRISAHADHEQYSEEELVAELGSSFLCAQAGISNSVIENQAAYLQGWMKKLKQYPEVLIRASIQAKNAVEYLLTPVKEEENMCAAIDNHQSCATY